MHPFRNLELPGFRSVDQDVWVDDAGVVVRAVRFDLVPDLPAALTDRPALRRGMTAMAAQQGGTLIDADIVGVGGQPALRQLVKVPLPDQPHGEAFLGSFTVPKAAASAVLLVQAAERGMTGIREAVILGEVGPQDYFQPHPYAPEVALRLPFHVADDERYDERFPLHPLTLVRRLMARLAEQVTLEPGFAALPPFAG
ncbi:hypothetical protein QEZ54_16525 [Catellatospora sp. KI3]|uniref:hypothetical protein n=1 Tax=Catellatospora sp. KI3 TaxID=3041620 RepID=UPI0024822FB5|nr:hypothetical protein [Catellatospora sp. KI3]MDI1462579.1 hypothetical protein [Catellatospora sp. KI3]